VRQRKYLASRLKQLYRQAAQQASRLAAAVFSCQFSDAGGKPP